MELATSRQGLIGLEENTGLAAMSVLFGIEVSLI